MAVIVTVKVMMLCGCGVVEEQQQQQQQAHLLDGIGCDTLCIMLSPACEQ